MAHLTDADADFFASLAWLDLRGYLESWSPAGEVDGRMVVLMRLRVPSGESTELCEIIAYGQEAGFCRGVEEEDQPLIVTVRRPKPSELGHPVQHTGMVAVGVDWWWPDEEAMLLAERGYL